MLNITEITNLFIRNNRALVAANKPDDWNPAILSVDELLNKIDESLDSIVSTGNISDNAKIVSILLTVMAEAGQYRHEQFIPISTEDVVRREIIDNEMLPAMGKLRKKAISIAKKHFVSPIFKPIWNDLRQEIFPLLDSMDPDLAPERFMPFRVIQIGNIAERLYGFRTRTMDHVLIGDENQAGLLQEIYNRKYLRFGTSGVRGRWQVDLTEQRTKQVAQAICDYLRNQNVPDYVGAEDLNGKRIVIGYDSRRNARLVAEWIAQVCIANGFKVDIANRDTPTPALVFYLTDHLDPQETAGLINCTASHNPPEWQGIKFNPRLGYPAPTNVTDFIAFRINEMQLLDQGAQVVDLTNLERQGAIRGFDPISDYSRWILASGHGNNRISIDLEAIRSFFIDKFIVVDEMHGAGRGYLTKLLGEIGVRHKVIHAERDPNIPGLDYADPEEPYIDELKKAVLETGAYLGVGLDTDSDRFGVVDKGGHYFRPNQILPMLVRYLGVERKLTGRVIATQTGSPLIEILASQIPNNESSKPIEGTIPLYVKHPFYRLRIGSKEARVQKNTFLVPVGIKYIEEIRRMDREYRVLKLLPENWRDTLLIGGEESSGLTTRGHVPDKDGVWADLLVLDMLAYYAKKTKGKVATISDIWMDTVSQPGCWISYGGRETNGSHSGRTDIDAVLEAKEALIDYFLDYTNSGSTSFDDMEIVFLGGIRYDIAEIQLRDKIRNDQHFLRVRASGTEPINRIYVESSNPTIASNLMQNALKVLEGLSIRQIKNAESQWRLVDILCQTRPEIPIVEATHNILTEKNWDANEICEMLRATVPSLEQRIKKIAMSWVDKLEH